MPTVNKVSISVILPTYNEKENILDLIAELGLYISNHIGESFELIVVDDDSPDLTWKTVEALCVRLPQLKLIRRNGERCLASAIWRGIQEARGEVIAWMDCDFSMPPYKLIELVEKVYEGYDIAVGSRLIKGGKDIRGPTDSWLAVIGSRMMNGFISFALGWSFKDYTSGFAAVRREVFDRVRIQGDYGEYFIDFIYHARKFGFKVVELPYYCLPRRKGTSKTGDHIWDYFKKGWKYILLTIALRTKG